MHYYVASCELSYNQTYLSFKLLNFKNLCLTLEEINEYSLVQSEFVMYKVVPETAKPIEKCLLIAWLSKKGEAGSVRRSAIMRMSAFSTFPVVFDLCNHIHTHTDHQRWRKRERKTHIMLVEILHCSLSLWQNKFSTQELAIVAPSFP